MDAGEREVQAPENEVDAGEAVQDTDNHAPTNDAANVVGEQVVLNIEYIDYIDIANQLNAAADAIEQSLANMDPLALETPPNAATYLLEQVVEYMRYYAPDAQSSSANVVQLSFRGSDYNALVDQLRAAADVYQQSVLDDNFVAQENHHPQSSLSITMAGENGEMGSNDGHGLVVLSRYPGYSDFDEDALYEYEPFPEDETPIHQRPASRSVVRNLASVTFTHEESEARDLAGTCAVCHDEFHVGDTAKMLPCSHYYHEGCILTWLDCQHTCPLCRYELPTDDA